MLSQKAGSRHPDETSVQRMVIIVKKWIPAFAGMAERMAIRILSIASRQVLC